MLLSELQAKKIVSVVSGKNLGSIMDVDVGDDGKIKSLLIEQAKVMFSLNRESNSQIYWEDITKIGEDVILVKRG